MTSMLLQKLNDAPWALRDIVARAKRGYRLFAPPPGVKTELGRHLWTPPRPLIHPQAGMIVIFSHKSACTNVVIWFLHHLGHAKAASDFHVWPHEYRDKIYYYTELYRAALDLDLTKFAVVRVIRDPWTRAVSSFRHALEWDYADRAIAKLLKRRDVAEKGLSFAEFLDLLERSDLSNCDEHFRMQHHPLEELLPVRHLINVTTENLFTRLNQVEVERGLSRTDLASMPWVRKLSTHHRPFGDFDDASEVYTRRLSKHAARHGPWPNYEAFLIPEARARIARLYAADITAYCRPETSQAGLKSKLR